MFGVGPDAGIIDPAALAFCPFRGRHLNAESGDLLTDIGRRKGLGFQQNNLGYDKQGPQVFLIGQEQAIQRIACRNHDPRIQGVADLFLSPGFLKGPGDLAADRQKALPFLCKGRIHPLVLELPDKGPDGCWLLFRKPPACGARFLPR